jgi:hypothetical protein
MFHHSAIRISSTPCFSPVLAASQNIRNRFSSFVVIENR